MFAVLKHELRSYFQSFTAYVFGTFLLVIVGIGSMLYNLQAAVSNFEYVLSFSSIIYVVIVPLLTMRVIAEERRQKTDYLLYALPITMSQVVLGKYLALLVVFLIPMAVLCVYPCIFSLFAGCLWIDFCFFLYGCCFNRNRCIYIIADRESGAGSRYWCSDHIIKLFQC